MVKFMDNKGSGFNQWMTSQNKKTGTDKKTSKFSSFLWWVVIFVLAWWLFSIWFGPKPVQQTAPAEVIPVENLAKVPVSKIDGDKVAAQVQGLRISKIELLDYSREKNTDNDQKVTLLGGEKEFAEVGLMASGTTAPTTETIWKTENVDGIDVMTWRNSDRVEFKRTLVVEDYIITIRDEIKNNSGKDIAFAPYARMMHGMREKTGAVSTGAIAYVDSDIERDDWKSLDKKSYAYQTQTGFAGFADQYWETIVSASQPDQLIQFKKADTRYQMNIAASAVPVAKGESTIIETKIFAGPRDQKILGAASESIPGLNKTIDYGWFWFLSRPLLWSLNALHGLVMNYGVAIILLTIALRLLMWPLTRKSYTSMAAMQKMQPEMARIQKLYANDKSRMQMEMMKLYQTHKTSPMSGCLPMLIQIPIFFGLYKALLISVPMRQASFLWISDLSVMDPYFILPVLMGLTMWYQQRLQTAGQSSGGANDTMAQTQKMMKWMPIVFTVMFAWMPAGLVLYWTVSNLFAIIQMYIIKRKTK